MIDGQFTLGVEEEYQIVDPETCELRSYISRLIEDGKSVLRERVRAELHQSMVEVGTTVCKDVAAVRSELVEMRGELARLAQRGGLAIAAASTHPFSDWKLQEISDGDRYREIVHDLQDVARANLIFGLHVHVGIKEKAVALALANEVRYFLPHLLALTCSSPFWMGRKSGLLSTRSLIFKRFPRTGIPDAFNSPEELNTFINLLVKTGCIDNGKRIWWDVRTHYLFDTVEIRICDMPTNIEDTLAVVALIQALLAKLYLMYRRNTAWRTYQRSLIEENKWRALRFGVAAKLIDFGRSEERPFVELVNELLEFVKEASDIFGTTAQLERIRQIAESGSSADKQIAIFEETKGDLRAVMKWVMAETMKGI